MNTKLIAKARDFAERHHEYVYRKHMKPLVDYFTHVEAVATRASFLRFAEPLRSNVIAAAYCHDTLEDQNGQGEYITESYLRAYLNAASVTLVKELTNPSKDYPDLPRDARKEIDREHIAQISDAAKLIKLIDRTHNLSQLELAPLVFQRIYLEESRLLLNAIGLVNHENYHELRSEYCHVLGVIKSRLDAQPKN